MFPPRRCAELSPPERPGEEPFRRWRVPGRALLAAIFAFSIATLFAEGWGDLVVAWRRQPPARFAGPEATNDLWLSHLRIDRPSHRIRETLSWLPAGEPVLFVSQEGNPAAELTYYQTSILAWPRPVHWLACPPPDQPVRWVFPGDHPRFAWLAYFGRPAPADLGAGASIARDLVVVSTPVSPAWPWYCRP